MSATRRNIVEADLEKLRTFFTVETAASEQRIREEIQHSEKRVTDAIAQMLNQYKADMAHQPAAQPPPNQRPPLLPATAQPLPTDRQHPGGPPAAGDLVVLGDSMTKVLRTFGLSKLANKSVSINSTSGALPATFCLREIYTQPQRLLQI